MNATTEKNIVKRGPNPPLVQTSVRLPEVTRKALKEFSAEKSLFEQTIFDDALSNHFRWAKEFGALAEAQGKTVPALIDELLKDYAEGKKARDFTSETMRARLKKGDSQEGQTE